jgi:hypothetical protein
MNHQAGLIATLAAAITSAAVLTGCGAVAVQMAPAKVASSQRSAAALSADALFWDTLHSGRYDGIAPTLKATTAAYLQDPNDDLTAAHVGWLHIWRLAESSRLTKPDPLITDDAILARRYFQEAVALNPTEARYLGFLGATQLTEASIHHDQKLQREGWFNLQAGIAAWPEFNLFTAGYVMSNQPADSERFQQGLAWQWQTLDECAGAKVNRADPDFHAAMALATTTGPKRACWNSWIAPHNFEGFFLNMGDMLVKSGDWQTARKVYANARLSPTYASWAYSSVLDQRIEQAQGNVADFSRAAGADRSASKMMFGSDYACMACHRG